MYVCTSPRDVYTRETCKKGRVKGDEGRRGNTALSTVVLNDNEDNNNLIQHFAREGGRTFALMS